MRVHAYLSGSPGPRPLFSPHLPTDGPPPPREIFLMRSISHRNAILRNTQHSLLRCHGSRTLIVSLSYKVTAWVCAVLAAWKLHMSVRYNFRASCVQGALCAKANMARALLAYHSFTLAYAPKLSLSPPCWGSTSGKCAP